MAKNLDISTITGINQVGNSYQRKNPIPLDYYSSFNTRVDAENYAKTNAVAYVGQVISFKESATDSAIKVCVIKNEAGDLESLNNVEVKIPSYGSGNYITVETDSEGNYTINHNTLDALEKTEEEEAKTTFITEIIRDDYGHITGYKTASISIPDVSLDDASVARNTSGAIEVKGFEAADVNGLIPQVKIEGDGEARTKTLEWVSVQEAIAGIEDKDTVTGVKSGNTGVSVEKAATPDSGDDRTYIVSHAEKPTSGTAQSAEKGSGRTYITEVLVDDYGHVAGVKTATETDQDIPEITITDKTGTDTDEFVYVVSNLVESGAQGHTITASYQQVPTKDYVDRVASGATDYLGTVATEEELAALNPGKGDFVRVSVAFGDYHASDMLICESSVKDGDPITSWSVIHGEIDTDTWTKNTKDADGFVTKGDGQANKVWKTDENGNPDWRDEEVGPTGQDGKFAILDNDGKIVEAGDIQFSSTVVSEPTDTLDGVAGFIISKFTQLTQETNTPDDKVGFELILDKDSGLNFEASSTDGNVVQAKLGLSSETKEAIDNAMPKLAEDEHAEAEGHYAIFDANGQVVDGGYMAAGVASEWESESNSGYFGFQLYEQQYSTEGTEGLGGQNPLLGFDLNITSDSGLAITNADKSLSEDPEDKAASISVALALSDSTKGSLAKADTALQEITTIDTSEDHEHTADETNCGGLKITQNKDTDGNVIPGSVNIEIDDSITFIFNCGSAADL